MKDYQEQLDRDGYYVFPNVLSREKCEHFKGLLEEVHARNRQRLAANQGQSDHGLQDKSQERVVYNLHNKNLDFFELIEHPLALEVMGSLLQAGSYLNSEPFVMLNESARSPLPGSKGQQLHMDSNFPGSPYALFAIALWMLDDFTPENGATRVVPGSHRFLTYAENGKKYDSEVSVCAPAGSLLVYNASLWHGGGDKTSEGTRWAAIFGYGRWFLKPAFDFNKCTPPEVWEKMTERQKDLLGFRCNPPKDEFTRSRRRSEHFEEPLPYSLPMP